MSVDLISFPVPPSHDVRVSLAPDQHWIVVRASQFAPTVFSVDVAPGSDVRLPDVVLDRGATFAGRVVDAAGAAIGGAVIEVSAERTKSGDDGRFALEHLSRVNAKARIAADGFLTAFLDWSPSSATPTVVVLRRGGLVRGTVRDAAGAPATGVDVVVLDLAHVDEWKQDEPSVDDAGAFSSRLPPGRFRIVIWRDGKQLAMRDVELAEGDETSVEFSVGK